MLNRNKEQQSVLRGGRLVGLAVALALVVGGGVYAATTALAYSFKAPTSLATTIVGSTKVEAEWLHVSGAPAYVISATPSGGSALTFRSANNTVAMTGLKRGTSYTMKVAVAASASAGASRLSAWSSNLKFKTANNALNAPSDLAVKTATTTTATLTWTAPDNVASTDRYKVTYALDSALKKSPKSATTDDNTASIKITGMASNTNFYARVKVVAADGTTVRSDISDYTLIKTRAEFGYLSGTVAGPAGSTVVVEAYDKGSDVVGQADVASNGTFKITVRPGTYRVLANYNGSGDYGSLWATSGSAGSVAMANGTQYTVATGATTSVGTTTLSKVGKAAGTVKGTGVSGGLANVDVTAMIGKEVIARATTDSSGDYELDGLAAGDYTIRFKYRGISGSGVGFKPTSKPVTVSGTATAPVATPTLALDSWAKIIRSKIKGTKSVGHTLKRYNTAWRASYHPNERASSWDYQWLRNGSPISGANSYKYKLRSADRGKKISLRITYRHIGFPTGSTTSKAYTVH